MSVCACDILGVARTNAVDSQMFSLLMIFMIVIQDNRGNHEHHLYRSSTRTGRLTLASGFMPLNMDAYPITRDGNSPIAREYSRETSDGNVVSRQPLQNKLTIHLICMYYLYV